MPETFSVEVSKGEGVEVLLKSLPVILKEENLITLGIVVDADDDLAARWQALSNKLKTVGYQNIPDAPPANGWVYTQPRLPKIGAWLMQNNHLPGMLEDFVAYLVPSEDILLPKAEAMLQDEQVGINRYSLAQHPKALIHPWLAWQKKPGMPMGQAITAQVLKYDSVIAPNFIAWLKYLFERGGSE